MEILVPISIGSTQGELAPRVAIPERAVLALIDNGKRNASALLEAVGRQLVALGACGSYFLLRKRRGAGQPVADDERTHVSARADMVVTGVGDCGACSACSVHDALLFEESGRPATVVISTPFTRVASSVSAAMGFPGYHSVVVDHPVFGRTDDWLDAAAVDLVL